jgi:anti-sigma B factor antagonist
VSVIDLKGYLDAHTAPDLENAFQRLLTDRKYNIIVNCKDLTYISSAGLGVFMAFIEDVRKNKGDIKLSNMSPKVYNVFDLLGFPILYEIYREEQEAVVKFREQKKA